MEILLRLVSILFSKTRFDNIRHRKESFCKHTKTTYQGLLCCP